MNSDSANISMRNLSFSYPDSGSKGTKIRVLDSFNLEILKSTLTVLVGPNGCGKTTLLLCMAGLLSPEEGKVEIGKNTLSEVSCGYVFQNYRESLFPWYTVLDNIAAPLVFRGTSKLKAREQAAELLKRFGRSLPARQYPYTLSGGQQQLTAILRAVIHKPTILLLDEPFGSLDVSTRRDLQQALVEIWKSIKATTVLVTHSPNEALLMGDRVVTLSSKPAVVVDDFDINIRHPRKQEDLDTVEMKKRHKLLMAILGTGRKYDP